MYSFNLKFKILQKVNIADIKRILNKIKAFKALKQNKISNKFLKAYSKPLTEILTTITSVSFKLKYFLSYF